jgi:orotidine-5'-phosphate decarboxylase
MRDWGLNDDADGLRRFCRLVMEAAADRIAVVKPQSAFFERLGPPGLSELARAIAMIREQGALVSSTASVAMSSIRWRDTPRPCRAPTAVSAAMR